MSASRTDSTDPHAGSGNGAASDAPEAPADALRQALAQLGEFRDYAFHYLAARTDRLKLAVRNAVIWAVVGAAGLLLAGTILVIAVVLLLAGAAGAIATALGGRMWAGNLIVGGALLLLMASGTVVALNRIMAAARRRTLDRYEQKLSHQRDRNGHDALQRSTEYDADQHAKS